MIEIKKTIIDGYDIEVGIERTDDGHYLTWKDGLENHSTAISQKLFECLWEEF